MLGIQSQKKPSKINYNKIRPKKSSYFGLPNEKSKPITLLRMDLSPLRAHKYRYNFEDTSDPFCTTCGSTEDTRHYLLHCLSFRLSRSDLFQRLSNILGFDFTTKPCKEKIRILLYGNSDSDSSTNKRVLEEVANFILKSTRLDVW